MVSLSLVMLPFRLASRISLAADQQWFCSWASPNGEKLKTHQDLYFKITDFSSLPPQLSVLNKSRVVALSLGSAFRDSLPIQPQHFIIFSELGVP
jgi:hypothetical protein